MPNSPSATSVNGPGRAPRKKVQPLGNRQSKSRKARLGVCEAGIDIRPLLLQERVGRGVSRVNGRFSCAPRRRLRRRPLSLRAFGAFSREASDPPPFTEEGDRAERGGGGPPQALLSTLVPSVSRFAAATSP
jgi:hypothetical protein